MATAASRLRGRSASVDRASRTALIVGGLVTAAEVSGSAFLFSYLRHRLDDINTPQNEFQILGVDPELIAGLGLNGLSMFGLFGDWGMHAENIGNGALAAYFVPIGAAMGTQAREAAAARSTQPLIITQGRRMPQMGAPRSNLAAQMRNMRMRNAA